MGQLFIEYTMPISLNQNNVAERRNRTLLDMVWSMFSNSNLLILLWNEAIKTVVYILKCVPSKVVPKTTFELYKGWKSRLRHMHVWRCPYEERIYNPQQSKLNIRTISGYFIEYVEWFKCYRFYYPPRTTRIVESRNAISYNTSCREVGNQQLNKGNHNPLNKENQRITHNPFNMDNSTHLLLIGNVVIIFFLQRYVFFNFVVILCKVVALCNILRGLYAFSKFKTRLV